MQSRQGRSDPSHGIVIPNSSSASTLLWLFLHLHLLAFFSTSTQDYLWNWSGWCWTNTENESIHHVWNFPLSVCLRVGSWCQCIWFGSWGPNWFYDTTNQEQLCGFWEHVSLRGFFPLWSSSSLLRCLQRCTTKLAYEKNSRLGKKTTLFRSSISERVNSAKWPNSSVGRVPVVNFLGAVHMEEEVQDRVQVEVERKEQGIRETRGKEQGDNRESKNKRSTAQHGWPWVWGDAHKHILEPWCECTSSSVRTVQENEWRVKCFCVHTPSVTVDRHRL